MLGTYAATLLACGSALIVGQAVLSVCGWRQWSWLAPVIGLGPVVALAWGAVQLPGEGATALGAVLAVSAAGLIVLVGRTDGVGESVREGLPAAAVTLVAASIPFIVEGRFGVLGTGFNVDMSQHLFAADWLADPSGPAPGLVEQGYPLGPHGLAVAAAELGNLVHGFSGVTIAVPVLAALCSLVVLRELPPVRRAIAAALVALPYVVASYLAQGQFKELLEGLFLLGFALCLHQLAAGWAAGGPPRMRYLAAVPLAAIALGSLYSYSAPGLAWLAAAGVLFAAAELVRRRRSEPPAVVVRRVALPVSIGLLVLVAGVAPELGRVVDFQGNAAKVARSGEDGDRQSDRRGESEGGGGTGGGGEGRERHNDDLGNLFNEIPPLEALGVWPSGDFRVDPGDGAAPAIAFYLGSLVGALALLLALARWLRRGETAVPAALMGAILIYAAAWAFSTPYAAAKAIMMIAPLAMLITVRELLDPAVLTPAVRSRGAVAVAAVAGAFVVAAAASSVLALGNAPVGPDSYSPGLAKMRSAFEGQPTLVLADPQALADEHARDFLAWEARGGDPVCIEPAPESAASTPPPDGIRFVVTTTGETEPPFGDLALRRDEPPYALWERRGPVGGAAVEGPAGDPSECGLALGA